MPSSSEWKAWAEGVEASKAALRDDLEIAQTVLVVLVIALSAVVWWLYRVHRERVRLRHELAVQAAQQQPANTPSEESNDDVPRLRAELSALESRYEHAYTLSETLNREVLRLRAELKELVESTDEVHNALLAIEVNPSPNEEGEDVLAENLRLREVIRAYRMIVVYVLQTGRLQESVDYGIVIEGSSIFVCLTPALARMIPRDEIVDDGMKGEKGIVRFQFESISKEDVVKIVKIEHV
ncbi:MAG: hypothetical protein UY72_C0057G0007 [Candidatus Uhrbacteria bacterium GW2011_GWD2_52_7]|uniref:Uncharacterized protein n=1 Tax=Candidatus Uhrbacteria bacterium GW2011_GWD2_52_7 TaxID=1618989 RepID=A0A0G1XCC2_9BACT|nr:MAG: hypothetical protein UY72_C0057G0007 [Candidatus Uhrbacteria bacterium GW2011_GWD2_52_7]